MILQLVAFVLLALSSAEGSGEAILNPVLNCHTLELIEICSGKASLACREELSGDWDAMCAAFQDRQASSVSTVIREEQVSFDDVSVPVILEMTSDAVVSPGGTIRIECLAEGAPTPFVDVTWIEYSDLSPISPEDSEQLYQGDVTKAVVQHTFIQHKATIWDSGWFRCVAKNGQGVVYKETYVEVKDICKEAGCEEQGMMCEADYASGAVECVCPYCTNFNDLTFVCGSDCSDYYGECTLLEENCLFGRNTTVYKHSLCDNFDWPEFSILPPVNVTVERGGTVTLTCQAEPAGATPGPPPTINWYRHTNTQERTDTADPTNSAEEMINTAEESNTLNRELIGVGNILEMGPLTTKEEVQCVAHHCAESYHQNKEIFSHMVSINIKAESIDETEEEEATEANVRVFEGSTCTFLGDGSAKSFDNLWYDQSGVCSYVLAMDCLTAQWFIYGTFVPCGATTCLTDVTLIIGRTFLQFQRGWLINEQGTKLLHKAGQNIRYSSDILIQFDGLIQTVTFFQTNTFRWNGYDSLQIVSKGVSCGLCGHNTGQAGALETRWEGTVSDVYQFVSSWMLVVKGQFCSEHGTEIENEEDGREVCAELFNHEDILPCHETVSVESFERSCRRSVANNQFPGEWSAQCESLQSYVLACKTAGTDVPNRWRRDTGCDAIRSTQQFILSQGCPQDYPPV